MSNALSVRRVMVQTLDENGKPEGPPTFGIMAADDHAQHYNDAFLSFEELDEAIKNAESILEVLDPNEEFFAFADHDKIGYGNFYGKDWETKF